MAYFSVSQMQCCGVKEIHGINTISPYQTGKDALKELLNVLERHVTSSVPAHYIFTSNGGGSLTRLKKLQKAIEDAGLGTCVITPSALNPNTSSSIKVMVWTPSKQALKDTMHGVKPKRPKQVRSYG